MGCHLFFVRYPLSLVGLPPLMAAPARSDRPSSHHPARIPASANNGQQTKDDQALIFLACSSACSMAPTYMKAPSVRWSHLPSQISLKLRTVSGSLVYWPGLLVNGSATKNGCDRNRSIRRARWTT